MFQPALKLAKNADRIDGRLTRDLPLDASLRQSFNTMTNKGLIVFNAHHFDVTPLTQTLPEANKTCVRRVTPSHQHRP